MKDDMQADARRVWLMAAGFGVPGGIEAHILHYAVEMRRRGWSPEVLIFFDYPHPPHRFMTALDAAGIPRHSLNRMARNRTWGRFLARVLPWSLIQLVKGRRPRPGMLLRWLEAQGQIEALRRCLKATVDHGMGDLTTESRRRDLSSVSPNLRGEHSRIGLLKPLSESQIHRIHVFGRLPHLAWAALPAERTIFHQMMTGDIDGIWTPEEMAGFVAFAERCHAFLAPGDGVIANLRRHFGIRRDILPVYTLCPDTVGADGVAAMIARRRAGGDRPLRFGVICRLTKQKGIAFLLEALAAYQARFGDVRFAFAGEGDLEEMIRAFTDRHALAHVTVERVIEPATFLSTIDVFVHPSIGDAMPMAIAEALMCGLPCVVSRVGGCPDLVRDGEEGCVIEPGRSEAIFDAMIRFAEMSGEARAAYGRRARERFEAVCLPRAVGDVVEGVYG